ncbi:MAG TPA: bifunctional DNA primase/polymerase [Ktedonobacterales bacterium]|nr:bifunctional DNA primase/polymerase [Ktedonobacterales bacterium]
MPPNNSMLAAALAYAAEGLPVFPLQVRGKLPIIPKDKGGHGCLDATTDAEQICAWWKEYPRANIGIATSAERAVLDVDKGHGGYESLADLEAEYGPLPATRRARSGNGGLHIWFTGQGLKNKQGPNWGLPGLDWRGKGGYVVAPPSTLGAGKVYEWENRAAEIAPAPEWLIKRLTAKPHRERAEQEGPTPRPGDDAGAFWLEKALQQAQDGNRNATGFWLACQLRDSGLSQQEAEHIMLQYATRVPAGNGPYTDKEALNSAASAYSLPARPPAKSQEPRPAGAGRSTRNERNQRNHQGGQPPDDGAPDAENTSSDGQAAQERQRVTQVNELIAIARARAAFFCSPEGEHYASVRIGKHTETLLIGERGGAFKRWLVKAYFDLHTSVPNATALASAITLLESIAQYGDAEQEPAIREVHTRVATHDGKLYLDLADNAWNVIEIDAEGWRVVKEAPVYFRRPNGMLPLPMPRAGGTLDELRQFINVGSDEDWMLLVSWLLMVMHPTGPYPDLELHGERGATKSSATRMLRQFIDPSQAPARVGVPKDERDLAIYAKNARIVAFDNLSHLPAWFSDALCGLSTGSGSGGRKLYTDDEEAIFQARRPVVMNGIEELATRGDLLDRCIIVNLTPPEQRLSEKQLLAAFTAAHARMLGAFLDTVSAALRNQDAIREENLPRMADFARWTMAAEQFLGWQEGAWLTAYINNRATAVSTELEASPVAAAIKKLLADVDKWEGTATALAEALAALAAPDALHSRAWPKGPRALSGAMTRLAPSLRQIGVIATSKKRSDATYFTLLKQAASGAKSANNGANDSASGANSSSSGAKTERRGPENTRSGGANGANGANVPPSYTLERAEKDRQGEGWREGEEGRNKKAPDFAPFAPFAPSGRDIVNSMPVDGTSAKAPAWQEEWDALSDSGKMRAIKVVKDQGAKAAPESETAPAPVNLSEVREQTSAAAEAARSYIEQSAWPLLPWQPAWDDMPIKQRLYWMTEALGWPACEPAGILAGDRAAWYHLCYEPGHINEASEAYDALRPRFERKALEG